MITKEDIISQIVGLLVMEQGLFVAALRLLEVTALLVILALFFFAVITLVMLVSILPSLISDPAANSLKIKDHNLLREEAFADEQPADKSTEAQLRPEMPHV
jgi:hypothetical protein